jgi:protein SCO1/2
MRYVVMLLLAASFGCSGSGCAGGTPPNSRASENLDYPVGDFSLTERSERTVTSKDLQGKVWIASFVFTHCPGPCKEVTATVSRLQKEFSDLPDVRFVTFTIDPKRDDAATLRQYAMIAGADGEKWLFLTGDEPTIHKLLLQQFKQSVGVTANAKPGEEFGGHSTRLSVVDKKGVIRAIFDGVHNPNSPNANAEYEENMRRLKGMVRELAGE